MTRAAGMPATVGGFRPRINLAISEVGLPPSLDFSNARMAALAQGRRLGPCTKSAAIRGIAAVALTHSGRQHVTLGGKLKNYMSSSRRH
jgi:hypothetical protein